MIRLAIAAAILLGTVAALAPPAGADQVKIVAVGASNTYGMGRGKNMGGVNPAQAYPAQLQALLKARGVDASVRNAGIPGDTTGGMLARLGTAVPNGTHIVILEPGRNDDRRGIGEGQRDANVAEITRRLQARGVKVVLLERSRLLVPPASRHPDGQHFDARGHAVVAASLIPRVMAAIK